MSSDEAPNALKDQVIEEFATKLSEEEIPPELKEKLQALATEDQLTSTDSIVEAIKSVRKVEDEDTAP